MLENKLSDINDSIKTLISVAYDKGRDKERKRIIGILEGNRHSLNVARGGSYCDKPYLQKNNHIIDYIDELLSELRS